MWDAVTPPVAFENASAEGAFLQQYRRSGLRLAKIAFVVAAAMALSFWIVLGIAATTTQESNVRQLVRLGLFLVLAATASYLHIRERQAIESFRSSVGVPMAIACVVIGSMGLVPLDSGEFAVNRFAVAMSLTCWLCYGFTRLPVAYVALVCLPASVLTLIGASVQGDDHVLALGIYLVVANLIGWIMSVEIERRERALFWSSRQLAEATRAMEVMARSASEADAAKTRVLAAVSHDLRQPLASLSLYAQLLRSRNDVLGPAGLLGTVDRLEACVSALSGNLDRLAELGGLRDRGAALPVARVDLRRVLDRIESVYSAEASRRGVRLVVRSPRPGRELALSNEDRLWDVLSNLAGNALKFTGTRKGAWVLIRVRRSGTRVVVEVRDNGIGITPADQRRVFDEYFQVGNHARNPEHGYGLGLSIVRETISRLPGHSISLASRPGGGSRFALAIPLAGPAMEAHPSPPAAARAARTAGGLRRRANDGAAIPDGVPRCQSPRAPYLVGEGTGSRFDRHGPYPSSAGTDPRDDPLVGAYVLFVEDDDSMRDALGQLLGQWGLLVDAAASGEEAVRLAAGAERSYDAIVSDFRLPGAWDGLRLIEELRRLEASRTPAILLSGEFRVEALRSNAPADVHVMAKPLDVDRLRGLLTDFARGVDPAPA